jgi:chromosome segregation ATPase
VPSPASAPTLVSPDLSALERDLAELRRSIGALDPRAIADRAAEAARADQPTPRQEPTVSAAEVARVREVAEAARTTAESARMTAESARMGAEGARMVADAARGTAEAADRRCAGETARLTQLATRLDAAEAVLGQLRGKVEEGAKAHAALEGRIAELEVKNGHHEQAIGILDRRILELDEVAGKAIQLLAAAMR